MTDSATNERSATTRLALVVLAEKLNPVSQKLSKAVGRTERFGQVVWLMKVASIGKR